MTPASPLLVVCAALIDADGRVLLARIPDGKPHEGAWEFPGGKVEPGETPESALIRELEEELGIATEESCLAPLAFGTDTNGGRPVVLLAYACRKWRGLPAPREGQTLTWTLPGKLLGHDTPPADKPIAAAVRDLLAG